MRPSEFEQQLEKSQKTSGGIFLKADFHVHAPRSSDYEYKNADAEERLGEALRENDYSFAIILAHGETPDPKVFAELHKHCPRTELIPGAEINIFVDAIGKKVLKDYFFHCVVAVDPSQPPGEYGYVLKKAREDLTYRSGAGQEGFTSAIADVAKFFLEQGALFIPAHLHQSKSPENSRSIDDIYDDDAFLGFLEEHAFSALEVRDISTAAFFDGTKKTADGRDIPLQVCVRSSDAHSHQHVLDRKRYTWVKCERTTFQELKTALSFRDRVSLTPPRYEHNHILGLHVCGHFIKDEWIVFNPCMNCLIGCKGTGKTSILECMRFLFGTFIPADRKDSVSKHVAYILGSSGFVECLVRRRDGSKAVIVRRADSPGRLTIVEENGASTEVETIEQTGFDVSILGWHEIELVAEYPTSRLALIDSVGHEAEIRRLYETIDAKVESARDQLPGFQRKVKQLDDKLRQRLALRNKRNTLKKLEKEALLQLQTEYEDFLFCDQQLANLTDRLSNVRTQMLSAIDSGFSTIADAFKEASKYPTAIQAIVGETKSRIQDLEATRLEGKKVLDDDLKRVHGKMAENLEKARQAFTQFRTDSYDPRVNALPPEEREILSQQIQIIEETKALPALEAECRSFVEGMQSAAKGIFAACDDICDARNTISNVRIKEVEDINLEIPGIHLKFLRSANQEKKRGYLRTYGSAANDIVSFVQGLGQIDSYENLRELFKRFSDFDAEAEHTEQNEMLIDAKFVDFMRVVDDDDVELSLILNGNPVPIQNLSAGQRCTAVFPLLLRMRKGPLIIDQPEDNLDNRHIADVIAPQLLEKKQAQQFIMTSHNANLVVLTDAELIMHVDSDGSEGRMVCSGFLACPQSKIKGAVLDVLDGGEPALKARQSKYGIR
jgi:recombinational DNA repair ATPase RecF